MGTLPTPRNPGYDFSGVLCRAEAMLLHVGGSCNYIKQQSQSTNLRIEST
jgi:hypothetical protein